MIQQHQRSEPNLIAKYKNGKYHKSYFYGGCNIDLKIIMCKDNIIIQPKLQSYIFHWYYTYILHPGMDLMKAVIRQHLYWTDIRDSVRKEVTNFGTCQCTKRSNKKYGKLQAK